MFAWIESNSGRRCPPGWSCCLKKSSSACARIFFWRFACLVNMMSIASGVTPSFLKKFLMNLSKVRIVALLYRVGRSFGFVNHNEPWRPLSSRVRQPSSYPYISVPFYYLFNPNCPNGSVRLLSVVYLMLFMGGPIQIPFHKRIIFHSFSMFLLASSRRMSYHTLISSFHSSTLIYFSLFSL